MQVLTRNGQMLMVMVRRTCIVMTQVAITGFSFQMEMEHSKIGVCSKLAGVVTQGPELNGLMSMVMVRRTCSVMTQLAITGFSFQTVIKPSKISGIPKAAGAVTQGPELNMPM